jgi:ClpP class serine protease
MPTDASLVLQAAITTEWAITPEYLATIVEIIQRDNPPFIKYENGQPQGVAAVPAKPVDGSRILKARGSVAIIDVNGPISRYAGYFDDVSALTSVERLAEAIQSAAQNPSFKGIILYIHSPGGDITGISELAGLVAEANKLKPVIAYVDGMMCSAAYWFGSAANEVVVNSTSRVGSLGIISMIRNRADKNTLEFISSQSPDKKPDLETDRGKAVVQRNVDDLAEVMLSEVAVFRGVSLQKVKSDFGQGGILIGQAAIDAGMADRMGSFEGLIKELAELDVMNWKPKARTLALADGGFTEDGNQTTATMAGRKEDEEMGLKERILALLKDETVASGENSNGQPAAGAGAEAGAGGEAGAGTGQPAQAATQPAQPAQAPTPDAATLAMLQAANERAVASECALFINQMKGLGKMVPAEFATFTENYIRASGMDMAHPPAAGQPGMVDMLKATISGRTTNSAAPVAMGETVPQNTTVIPAHNAGTGGAEGPVSKEREAHLLAQSGLGQECASLMAQGKLIPMAPRPSHQSIKTV